MTPERIPASEFAAPEIAHTIYQRSLGLGIVFGIISLIFAAIPVTR